MAFCENCGKEANATARFCSNCGHPIQPTGGSSGDLRTTGPANRSDLGELINSFGTLKKLLLYDGGCTVRGVGTDFSFRWSEIKWIGYKWTRTVTNVFAYNHELVIRFVPHEGPCKEETWRPMSMYVDVSKKSIKKLLSSMNALGLTVMSLQQGNQRM